MNRRDFLAHGGLAALAAALAACGDGIVSGVGPLVPVIVPGVDSVVVQVADFPELAQTGALVQVSAFFAAKRTGPGSFDAFSMACTHEGCLTSITNAAQFDCPCHASRFDSNGDVLRGPATRPLTRLVTSFDPVTGELTIN